MPRNEHTSPELATQAALVIAMTDVEIVRMTARNPSIVRSAFASLLTQTRAKAKKPKGV